VEKKINLLSVQKNVISKHGWTIYCPYRKRLSVTLVNNYKIRLLKITCHLTSLISFHRNIQHISYMWLTVLPVLSNSYMKNEHNVGTPARTQLALTAKTVLNTFTSLDTRIPYWHRHILRGHTLLYSAEYCPWGQAAIRQGTCGFVCHNSIRKLGWSVTCTLILQASGSHFYTPRNIPHHTRNAWFGALTAVQVGMQVFRNVMQSRLIKPSPTFQRLLQHSRNNQHNAQICTTALFIYAGCYRFRQ
jgi:hypothetical protein